MNEPASPERPVLPELPAEPQLRWEQYIASEGAGAREQMLGRLGSFIDSLDAVPDEVVRRWALALATLSADGGLTFDLRFPLFREVLFPALREGLDVGTPGCARGLAHFRADWLWPASEQAGLAMPLRSKHGLLGRAIEDDPSDVAAGRELVVALAERLESSVHEVPSMVLFDSNAATVEQCDVLLTDLSQFRTLVEIYGSADQFAELDSKCTFHFAAYRLYRTQAVAADSYLAYLEQEHGSNFPR